MSAIALAAGCSVAAIESASADVNYAYYTTTAIDGSITATVTSGSGVNVYTPSPSQIFLLDSTFAVLQLAWCIDIATPLAQSGSYGVDPGALPANPGAIGALVYNGNQLLAGIDPVNGAGSITQQQQIDSEAIQLAIWDVEYNTAGSSIVYSGVDADVLTAANTYLQNVTGGTWAANPNIEALSADGTQTLIAAAAAPEASTWVMALVGFAALGAAGYRRPSAPSASRA
ncbi:PEP-CTERM sorting domain-containing protein [Roseiarcus fermentans]|nr:PEP-CTERM sorting domain-containing protein [Roseiarcus fermentans]